MGYGERLGGIRLTLHAILRVRHLLHRHAVAGQAADFVLLASPARHLGVRALHHLEIVFQTKEQPAFNRQFELLINDLKKWDEKKFQLYLFAENPI